MAAFRFIHTADLHLGRRFGNFPEEARGRLVEARHQIIPRLIAAARDHGARHILVAGDLFDTETPSDGVWRQALLAMGTHADVHWWIIPGNHDSLAAESLWTRFRQRAPGNVHLVGDVEPIEIEPGVFLLPAPLPRRFPGRDLTAWMAECVTDPRAMRIGLAHGAIRDFSEDGGGAEGIIPPDRAQTARLDYLALGDWHGTREISQRAWYAGTPEPDRFKDNLPGNVLLVTIEGPGKVPKVDRIPIGHYKWHDLTIELHCLADLATLTARLEQLGAPYDQHVVQLELRGTVDLETRQALESELRRWRAKLHLLRLDLQGLIAQPSEADLQPMLDQGFVGVAVSRLREMAANPELSEEERARARRALGMLYAEFVALAGGGTGAGTAAAR
jgi:DNA repair exonuclease SbcCD nuclease subunit